MSLAAGRPLVPQPSSSTAPSTSSTRTTMMPPSAPVVAPRCVVPRRALRRPSVVTRSGSGGGMSYKSAGVDIDAGNELVRRIQKLNPSIGGFSGMVPFGDSFLVAGTDGVGTKLRLAMDTGIHDTIGIDLVAMSVNDIITSGAQPLFFLDYYATSKLDVDIAESVVKGIVEGCRQSRCVLLGGETAEMPGFYGDGDYDVAGFAVGAVKRSDVIDGSRICAGDVLVAIPSTGVHSNGFSLARAVVEAAGARLAAPVPWSSLDGSEGKKDKRSLGEALLTPTKIYVDDIAALRGAGVDVKGLVHVTGGGLPENLPRVLPKKKDGDADADGLTLRINRKSWEVPAMFRWMQSSGRVAEREMFRTFNMGVGMVAFVPSREDAERAMRAVEGAWVLGEVVSGGDGSVEFV